MLYDPSTNTALHAWLVKTLEPICDAEPEALATYIVALLKHEGPENELRKEVTKQLDEFFENGAASFVDTLFATLRSKSYIPYTTTPNNYPPSSSGPADSGIPIPLDALLTPSSSSMSDRGTKRPLDSSEADSRGPPKGPRLGDESEKRSSGGPYDRRRDDMNVRGGQMDGQSYQMPNGRPYLPKGVCRDYHLKGFCSRGALCKFSHDDIGLPLPMNMAMSGVMPFMGMYGAMPFGILTGQPSTYDPTDARMDMNMYTGGPSMPGGRNGTPNSTMIDGHVDRTNVQDLSHSDLQGNGNMHNDGTNMPNTSMASPMAHIPPDESSIRGGGSGIRGRGRGGHGTFGGGHQSFSEELENGRSTKTIVVEKIPEEHISLEAVNSWFKRYGTVTNVAIDAKGKKALVSFSTKEEARKAWAAEEAVFGNRFVKIFWHRPMEGRGVAGTRALQASAALVANMGAQEDKEKPQPYSQTPEKTSTISISKDLPKSNSSSKNISVLQSKEEQLAKHIAEQKELMKKLGSCSSEEKKQIMSRLRVLNAEMQSMSSSKKVSEDQSRPSPQAPEDKERKERDRLDAELDMHAKGTAAEDEETTEQLKEKLAKLQAEASALGITDVMSPAPPYRGSFRGRGRGRAIHRGTMRGGLPRGSMKLDNRTKSLLVKGVASHDEMVTQAVRSWFSVPGQLSNLEVLEDDSLIATFQTRAAAELAMGKGVEIPSVGTVKLSWYNSPPVKPPPPPQSSLAEKKGAAEHPSSPRLDVDTEESGWGNEDDIGRF